MDYHIDPGFFNHSFKTFRSFVEEKSGRSLSSFSGNPYIREQEGYKEELYVLAGKVLAFNTWKSEEIGTGSIVKRAVLAIELPDNNLVPYQPRFGEAAVPHRFIREALSDATKTESVESCIYEIFKTDNDEQSFTNAVELFGKQYPLLAYLFFLKDRSKYIPIAPTHFDFVFPQLGAGFKTAARCSWKNYAAFRNLMTEVRDLLAESLATEVTLLDAHSFVWILSGQMGSDLLAEETVSKDLGPHGRKALIEARIGQGQFRQRVVEYWSTCAVTGCKDLALLDAAHIKPWAEGTAADCLNPYNGILLSPNLHRCLDDHYITFADTGHIVISSRLSANDRKALGISQDMILKKMDAQHRPYLEHHRKNFAKSENAAFVPGIGKPELSNVA